MVNFDDVQRAQLTRSTPHLHVGAPGIFSDLFYCSDAMKEWGVESKGSYCTYLIPGKTAALVPDLTVEDLPLAQLQSRFLYLK